MEKLNKGIKTISLDASLAIPPKGIKGVEYVKGGIFTHEVSKKMQKDRLAEARENSVAAVMPEIPLASGVVDLVVDCFGPGMYLDDEKFMEYIREVRRVLKDGGDAHIFPISYSQDDYKNIAKNGMLNNKQSVVDGNRRLDLIKEGEGFVLNGYEQEDDNGRVRLGMIIKKNEYLAKNLETTFMAIKKVYPDIDFKIFDAEGSSAVIYESDSTPGLVYKVAKFTDEEVQGNNYFIEEAKKMMKLAERDRAPKLVKFHPEVALAKNISKEEGFPLGVSSERTIIVMEKIDYDEPIKPVISDEKFISEKNELINVFEELKMIPGDVELVWDKNREKVVVIDVGGMMEGQFSDEQLYQSIDAVLF